MRHIIAIIAAVCVAIAITHLLAPSQPTVELKRYHQSAREQQTLANASADRR